MKDSVTLRDIYGAISDLEEKLGKRFEHIEKRIDVLESFKERALGIMTVVSLALSGLFSFIWKKIEG